MAEPLTWAQPGRRGRTPRLHCTAPRHPCVWRPFHSPTGRETHRETKSHCLLSPPPPPKDPHNVGGLHAPEDERVLF